MAVTINKSLIDGIFRRDNQEYLESTNDKVQGLLTLAIEDLSKRIAYISFDNTILEPMNELSNGGFTDNSKFTYFLGVDSSQLEINTLQRNEFWKRALDRVVFAWKNRNGPKKKRRRKKKNETEEPKIKEIDPSKYTLSNLCEDLVNAMAEHLSMTSLVSLSDNMIKVIGKDDFGASVQINIYVVLFDGEQYKYFISRKKGFLKIDNQLRVAAFDNKIERVGDVLQDMIKVFNVLYYNINKTLPNQVFIESLLCGCPNELFSQDRYKTFLKLINYLAMSDVSQIKSNLNPDKTIFTDSMCGNSAYGYKKFISSLQLQ